AGQRLLLQCDQLLKELALGGRTIVCTIHQPSAKLFEMFRPAVLRSQSYHNPTDYFMEAVCGDDSTTPVGDARRRFGYDGRRSAERRVAWCPLSLRRFALANAPSLCGPTNSAVAKEKADAAILADNASATSSSTLMPTFSPFRWRMNIFLREHLNYWYSVKAYYLAKTLADLPFQPLEFMRYFLFLTHLRADQLGGAELRPADWGGYESGISHFLVRFGRVRFCPVTAIPILLFSGFFVTFSTIPVYLQWLSYCSYVRYAFEAVLQIIYGMNRNHLECNPDASADSSESLAPCLSDPDFFLKFFSADGAKIYVDFIVLCMFFVILRGLL
uniref:ABC2_membrane domain-containing protein n=1 Tax=Macrostomum lignano TaxID=282301 RepID=A0A1I8JNC3_9PLAT